MFFLEKIKRKLWKYRVRRILKANRRERKSMGLNQAETVGIYTCYKEDSQWEKISFFANKLREHGLKVSLLVYSSEKVKPSILEKENEIYYFCRKDLGFLGVPPLTPPLAIRPFFTQNLDLFFDLSMEFHYIDVYVAGVSKAKFKLGKEGEWNQMVNDLSIQFQKDTTQMEYVKLLLKYLENFNA
ncbi:MAG: hypothetical protein RRX93_07980 [Bacteroidales bacterium]